MEWKTLKIDDVIDYQNGLWAGKTGTLTRAKVVRVTEMKDDGSYNLSTAKELQVEERKLEKRRIVPNSILLERSGGGENKPVGRVIIFGDDVQNGIYSFSNFTTLLLPKANLVYPKYLFYFLYFFHLSGKTKLLQKAVTGIRNLEFKKYLGQELPIPFKDGKPDLAEQKRIADKLDGVFAEIEKGINTIARENFQTAAIRQSLLGNIFANPEWKKVKLNDILVVPPQYGFTVSATNKKTGVQLLRITDIQNGAVDWSSVPSCVISDDELNRYLLKKNDLVFARTGATTGKTFLVTEDPQSKIVFASYLIRIRPSDFIYPKYLYLFFQSQFYWSQIVTRGGIKPNFNGTKLKNIEIPLPFGVDGKPDLAEQKRVAKDLDKVFASSEQLEKLFGKQEKSFNSLRSSVLNQSFQMQT